MKKHVGIFLKSAVCIVLSLSLSGCWNNRELDTLAIVMGIGIDKPEGSGAVQITAQIAKPGEIGTASNSKEAGGNADCYWNLDNTGETVFSTIRDLTSQSSRKLFFSHSQVLIFGRSLAEEGVLEYIDFFERDPETRGNVWILVAQDTAGEILDVKSELEKIPSDNIAQLVKGHLAATSQASAVRFRDFSTRLLSETTAPVATMIEVSGEGDQKVVKITGTAVFKKDKLVGVLDKTEGRGLLWVLGEIESGIIEVEGDSGALVGLEIVRASGKLEPELRDGKVIMKVTITEDGNVGELAGPDNVTELDLIVKLQEKEAEAIRAEVMAAVEKAKKLEADIFGLGDAVHQKYPKQWKDMERNWDEIFQEIEVEVNVDAKLRLLGRISKPIAAK